MELIKKNNNNNIPSNKSVFKNKLSMENNKYNH